MCHPNGKKTIVILTLVGLGALAMAQVPPPASAPATQPVQAGEPRLEISPPEFDFGEVWQGAPAKCEFTVKNVGTAPLTLEVRSGCGCTVATRPKSPLEPGESATFSTTYNTDTYTGPANKRVTVLTNDPDRKEVAIPVKGNVKPLFTTTPNNRINFQVVGEEEAQTQVMRLQSRYDKPLALKLKEGQDFGRFEVKLNELVPGKEWDLVVTTKPPLPVGFSRANVVLETGLETPESVSFFVSANAQPRVFATPPKLYVAANNKEPSQQILRVQSRDAKKPLKITGLEAKPDSIKCELLPEEAPVNDVVVRQIRVTLPAYDDLPAEGGKLVIHVDDPSPQYRDLEVPIVKYAAVMRKAAPDGAPGRPRPIQVQPREQPGTDDSEQKPVEKS